ncbi:DUF2125 domain-containing protein [Aestuariibius insulae]|uniref:DUF2125 domain-containing protein n=1 Tax=Aestuariibius insulae TaxID=2058287 RepID=UPI00345E3E33
MTSRSFARASTAVLALLAAETAYADVTASQVWDRVQQALDIYGEDAITIGSEETSGDTLTVSDLAMRIEDETGMVTTIEIDSVTFTEQGDGTVEVVYPASMPFTVTGESNDGEPFTVGLAIVLDGMDVVASGSPEDLVFDYTGDRYAIELVSIEGSGEIPDMDAMIELTGIEGSSNVTEESGQSVAYDLSADAMAFNFDMPSPEVEGEFIRANGTIDGVAITSNSVLPDGVDLSDPAQIYQEGVSATGGYTTGQANYVVDVLVDGQAFNGTMSSDGGQTDVNIVDGAFAYSGNVSNLQVNAAGDAVPFPIEVGMEQYAFGMTAPVIATEDARDIGLLLNFENLTMSDMIWQIFDPGEVLPRDPITVLMDLTGQARMTTDLVDPEAMENLAGPPGELEALTLNGLRISAAGAEVTGEGAFTFDNENPAPQFGGMPQPTGEVTFDLSGINTLMDNLVQMGIVPEEQLMGPRMMMGMFTTPTGEDSMTSTIEINEEGHVLANGQRIQ